MVLTGLQPRMEAAGVNGSELARRIGVSRASVSLWCTGGGLPNVALLPKIAEALGCSIDSLFYAIPTIPPAAEEDNKEFIPWRVG